MAELTTPAERIESAVQPPPPSADEFATLFTESRDDLFAYMSFLTADPVLAEELTAAAFERAFTKRRLFRPKRGDLRGWLFVIARNLAVDALRKRGRETGLDLVPEASSPDNGREVIDQRIELAAGMRKLQPRERELIALKFFAGLDNHEIATVLKISRNNVSTQLHRAMSRLRQEMKENHDDA